MNVLDFSVTEKLLVDGAVVYRAYKYNRTQYIDIPLPVLSECKQTVMGNVVVRGDGNVLVTHSGVAEVLMIGKYVVFFRDATPVEFVEQSACMTDMGYFTDRDIKLQRQKRLHRVQKRVGMAIVWLTSVDKLDANEYERAYNGIYSYVRSYFNKVGFLGEPVCTANRSARTVTIRGRTAKFSVSDEMLGYLLREFGGYIRSYEIKCKDNGVERLILSIG